jgi:hypothetical protein
MTARYPFRLGGKDYLLAVAKTGPRTFCMLLGKILPTRVLWLATAQRS